MAKKDEVEPDLRPTIWVVEGYCSVFCEHDDDWMPFCDCIGDSYTEALGNLVKALVTNKEKIDPNFVPETWIFRLRPYHREKEQILS